MGGSEGGCNGSKLRFRTMMSSLLRMKLAWFRDRGGFGSVLWFGMVVGTFGLGLVGGCRGWE